MYVNVLINFTVSSQKLHQVVIWDRIIETKDKLKLKETNEFVKYPLVARGPDLR